MLIDANILIYARQAMSAECRRLLERCARQEITGVMTTIVVAEFCHRRMMQEAQSRGLSGSNPAKALAQNRALVQSVESPDFTKAAEWQRTHGLLTNDSLNMAVAMWCGASLLAKTDPPFDSIPGITVLKPDDL